MSNNTIFWIDAANNKLAASWNSYVYAKTPVFKQGDEVQVTLRRIARPLMADSQMEEVSLNGATIDLEIGNNGMRPIAGKWYLQHNDESTELLDYDISAENLENALNRVHSIVVAGGVTVLRINDDGYKVIFADTGIQSPLDGFGEGLSPVSDINIKTVSIGSTTERAVFYIYIRQSIVSQATSSWTTETPVIAEVQQLTDFIWDISLTKQPKGGSFSVTVNDGEPVVICTCETPEGIAALLGTGFKVDKAGDYRWRVSKTDNSSFTLAIDSYDNLISFAGKTASVLVDSAKAAEMLSGTTEVTSTLQVSITENGKKETVLQTPCTIVASVGA